MKKKFFASVAVAFVVILVPALFLAQLELPYSALAIVWIPVAIVLLLIVAALWKNGPFRQEQER